MMKILGIDIGGTKTIAGVADQHGTLIAHNRILTPNAHGPTINFQSILLAADEVVQQAGGGISAIGIGCGGPLDRKTGTLHKVANLPGWEGLCLTQIFSERFQAPAYLDNDATAAAIGEARFGAGAEVDDFVYLTVSTGIGGGIIIGGQPYRGFGDNAGEIGHITIMPEGPACNCGDRGCLETLCSGTAIARIAAEGLSDNPQSMLNNLDTPITAESVAKAASRGDGFAVKVWSDAMYHLGLGVANVVNVLNPRLVIIGGGVAKAGDILFEPVTRTVQKRAMKALADDVRIIPAANGDLAGLMGAIAVALSDYLS